MKKPRPKRGSNQPAVTPRMLAYNILIQVMDGRRHLQNLLEHEFNSRPAMDSRDKALCQNLLYSSLRNWLWLKWLCGLVRNPNTLEKRVLYLILLALGELKFFRTPDYAAVNAWVETSRQVGLWRASGLINAVMRGILRIETLPEISRHNLPLYLSITYSHPLWLVQSWLKQFGAQETENWLKACQEEAPVSLRVNTIRIPAHELMARLTPFAEHIAGHPLAPLSLTLSNPTFPLPGFKEGWWQGQDPGATAVTALLGVKAQSRVLDMCAGMGGKSGHLAQLMQNQGELLALEISKGRALAWGKNMERLGVACAEMEVADATLFNRPSYFDYILLDAPCSGLGTTRRRPDVRWRRQPDDTRETIKLQRRLLMSAYDNLKPGGILLYATCTTAQEENDGNINWFMETYPDMKISWPDDTRLLTRNNFWQTYPHRSDCDGFFAARLCKL